MRRKPISEMRFEGVDEPLDLDAPVRSVQARNMTTTDQMKAKGIELGFSERTAYVFARHVDNAKDAIVDIFDAVSDFRMYAASDDPEAILQALRRLGSVIGYSNSIGTAWAELAAAAGAVAAILETA